jgi:phosphomevalonate kinase
MRSKQCKDHYLDQQFCWAFYRYTVGEVWDDKGGLGSSAMVIHAIKFCKAVLGREWHTSSSPEEYEYSGVLLCHDRSLGSIGSYRIGKIKGI